MCDDRDVDEGEAGQEALNGPTIGVERASRSSPASRPASSVQGHGRQVTGGLGRAAAILQSWPERPILKVRNL